LAISLTPQDVIEHVPAFPKPLAKPVTKAKAVGPAKQADLRMWFGGP